MYPYIHIGQGGIGVYGLCIALGGILAGLLALFNCKYSKLNRYDMLEMITLLIVGAIVGAKLLFIVVSWDTIAAMFEAYGINNDTLLNVMQGGYVFYGGFIGGLLAIVLYSRSKYAVRNNIHLIHYLMTIAPVIPLAHAFGRIGCFMAGCCYGIPDERFGIAFTHSLGAPNGIKLFPVQLLESFLLFILAAVMQIYFAKSKHRHCVIYIYLLAYPVIRIITERFRYDNAERGIYFGLSTSTWISIAILAVGAVIMILDYKKNRFNEPPEPEIILTQKKNV